MFQRATPPVPRNQIGIYTTSQALGARHALADRPRALMKNTLSAMVAFALALALQGGCLNDDPSTVPPSPGPSPLLPGGTSGSSSAGAGRNNRPTFPDAGVAPDASATPDLRPGGAPDLGRPWDGGSGAEAGPEDEVGLPSAPCMPFCAGVTCGGSDGCGGVCTASCNCLSSCGPLDCFVPDGCGGLCTGGCSTACTPSCGAFDCGASDGCGGSCDGGCGSDAPTCDPYACWTDDGYDWTCDDGCG